MEYQLYKITWKVPYVEYETFIGATSQEQALEIFESEYFENPPKDVIQSVGVVDLKGLVIHTKMNKK